MIVAWCCRWNPTVEEQAIDRAHRIGQTRDVHVTRIIIKGALLPPLSMLFRSDLFLRVISGDLVWSGRPFASSKSLVL